MVMNLQFSTHLSIGTDNSYVPSFNRHLIPTNQRP